MNWRDLLEPEDRGLLPPMNIDNIDKKETLDVKPLICVNTVNGSDHSHALVEPYKRGIVHQSAPRPMRPSPRMAPDVAQVLETKKNRFPLWDCVHREWYRSLPCGGLEFSNGIKYSRSDVLAWSGMSFKERVETHSHRKEGESE